MAVDRDVLKVFSAQSSARLHRVINQVRKVCGVRIKYNTSKTKHRCGLYRDLAAFLYPSYMMSIEDATPIKPTLPSLMHPASPRSLRQM
jgi:hypothetical protein